MFINLTVGNLTDALTGRSWDRSQIGRAVQERVGVFEGWGLAAGERVFLHHGNTLEFFVDLLAIWNLGGLAIPIDPRLTKFEIDVLARTATPRLSLWAGEPDSSIAAVLSAQGVAVKQTPTSGESTGSTRESKPSPLCLDQPALILFTSGTTGDPKGVVHTHRSLRARWLTLRQSLGIDAFRRTLCLLPTHFGHGLICNCLYPWLSGQDLYITPAFRPDIVIQLGSILDECGITFMSSVPAVWRLALKTARPPQSGRLQRVFCGSAPLSATLWKGIQEWTGTREVINSYGITETGSWVAGTTVPEFTPEDGLIGVPWGAVVKILKSTQTDNFADAQESPIGESGYVWLNTPALMQGYLGRDDLTRRVVTQGWFSTGDVGLIDERGWLYLRGREREEINKGGMKVYPGDIDLVAERFEQTQDVCTFAFEDALQGEDIGIAIVFKNAGEPSLGSLQAFLQQHLAKFQMPRRWYVLDEIPRTSRGKVNRSAVAKACAALTPIDPRG